MSVNDEFDETAFNVIKDTMETRFPVLAEKYTRNASLYARKAQQGVEDGDTDEIIANVHALKSSSAMLGFMGVHRCASEIEQKAWQGNVDLHDDMQRLNDFLRHSLEILEPYLNAP